MADKYIFGNVETKEYVLGNIEGPPGAAGPQGVSVTNAIVNGDGHLILTLSNGNTIDAGNVQGPQGIQGLQGAQGPAGKSAYQAAVSGGYTGTEAQFNALLGTLQTTLDGKLTASDIGKTGSRGVAGYDWTNSQLVNKANVSGDLIRSGLTGGTLGGGCASIVGTGLGAYIEAFASLDDYPNKRSQLILFAPDAAGPRVEISQTLDGKTWKPFLLATTTPPQEYDLPLAEGWAQQQPSVYFRDQFGAVHINIAIKASSAHSDSGLVASLPEGYRPPHIVETPAIYKNPDATGSIMVYPSGALHFYNVGGMAANQMLFGTATYIASG